MIVIILLIVGGVIGLFIYNALKPKTVLPSSSEGSNSSNSSSGSSSGGSSSGGSSSGGEILKSFSTPITQYSDDVRFLDRQNDIDCKTYGSALNEFKLQTLLQPPFGLGINYNVACGGIDPQFLSSTTTRKNTPFSESSGAIKFLDRHNLDCGSGAMTRFKMNTQDGNKNSYEYDCKALKNSSNKVCRTVETDWSGGSNALAKLNTLDVKCMEDESITQFQILNGANFGKWDDWNKYKYTCCRTKGT